MVVVEKKFFLVIRLDVVEIVELVLVLRLVFGSLSELLTFSIYRGSARLPVVFFVLDVLFFLFLDEVQVEF